MKHLMVDSSGAQAADWPSLYKRCTGKAFSLYRSCVFNTYQEASALQRLINTQPLMCFHYQELFYDSVFSTVKVYDQRCETFLIVLSLTR